MSPVPDDEDLFRFIQPRDSEVRPDGSPKLRSSLFHQRAVTVSVNLGSIWDLETQLRVAPPHCGLCSLTTGELRGVHNPDSGKPPIDVIPDPLDMDPLLGIPNPSHANVSRILTDSESKKAASLASQSIHRWPATAA
jgi:hypothetical protein